jgi:hypothetical protein
MRAAATVAGYWRKTSWAAEFDGRPKSVAHSQADQSPSTAICDGFRNHGYTP